MPGPEQLINEVPSLLLSLCDSIETGRNRLAIECLGEQTSYVSLGRRITGFANFLGSLGFRERSIIIFPACRSPVTIERILGTFLAGHTFLAIPPRASAQSLAALPSIRSVAFVAGSTGMRALSSRVRQHAPHVVLVDLPVDARFDGGTIERARCGQVDDRAIAYLSLTSGTTGSPKLVAGSMRNIAQFIDWQIGTFGLCAADRFVHLVSPRFDAVFRDTLTSLVVGASLHIPNATTFTDPSCLLHWMDTNRITTAHMTPDVLGAMARSAQLNRPSSAPTRVFCAGDIIPPSVIRAWTQHASPGGEVVNFYGSTEMTMVKMFHRVSEADVAAGYVPIGTGMKGAVIEVVDELGHPCAPGEPGELCVASDFLSLGYYTAQGLVPLAKRITPHRPQFYRSGDLALLQPNGAHRFLGRIVPDVPRSAQLKASEVEAALYRHPDVWEAAVVSAPGVVTAYVSSWDPKLNVHALRNHLHSQAAFASRVVLLDRLPRNLVGKIDRTMLTRPSGADAHQQETR